MKIGNVLVEQVNSDGRIVEGYDISLSVSEIYAVLCRYFPGIYKDGEDIICGKFGDKKYSIRIKNITYLGIPHPHFKKRIQISNDLQDFYQKSTRKGYTPLLLGVYTFEKNTVFCEFNIEDFINKKAHNSSAHVYTSDLADATTDVIFQKIDYFGNKITAFSPEGVTAFLTDKFGSAQPSISEYYHAHIPAPAPAESPKITSVKKAKKVSQIPDALLNLVAPTAMPEEIILKFWDFFGKENTVWNGIDCYKKMIAANYKNKFQPEWAGFFSEFEFEKYLTAEQITHLICYAQDKSKGGIDLDLFFPTINTYGDLKAHSDNSRGIQGNDWDTVFATIEKHGRIFYIVCEHSTVKDSDCEYVVTRFWNTVQHKEDLMSYHKRMKNSVTLRKVYILEINANNCGYLTMFKQGINSNGDLRAPKIMVEHDNLSHFVVAEKAL